MENEKKQNPDIELPLASDPLSLSHESAPVSQISAATEQAEQAKKSDDSGPRPARPAAEEPETAPAQTGEPEAAKSSERVKICPKCANRQTDFFSCRKCGLIFRNWRPKMERELFAALPDSIYLTLQEMHLALDKSWESDEAHQKFMQFCKNNNAVHYAARVYRLRAAIYPGDTRAAENLSKCNEFVGGMVQLLTPTGRKSASSSVTPGQIAVAVSAGVVTIILVFMLFDYLLK